MRRKSENNTFKNAALTLKGLIDRRRVAIKPNGPRLLFLCGANREKDIPSVRREAITRFLNKYYPNVNIILAEHVYKELLYTDGKTNLFDLENNIFKVSDYVFIVLEGYGSFCELGAFSHQSLREKLVVINDEKKKNSESFISLGPIRAIAGDHNGGEVIYYPMEPDGYKNADRIADTFDRISQIMEEGRGSHKTTLKKEDLSPEGELTKSKLFFLHDMVFFLGWAEYKNLVKLMKELFGSKDFRLSKEMLSILISIDFIYKKDGGFSSTQEGPIFDYNGKHRDIAISLRLAGIRSELRGTA